MHNTGVIISRDRRQQNNCSGEKEEWRRIRIQLLDLDHLRFGSTGLGLSVMRGARLRNRYQLAPNADRFAADARAEATEDRDVKKTSKRSFHPIGFDSNFFRSSTLEFPSRTPTRDRARVPPSNTSTPDPEPEPRPSPRNTPTRPSVRLPTSESREPRTPRPDPPY
ncbi:hypothetical protein SAY86_026065 [Trapa natans]|uniref:Uncharacterized protein n=1 Tax=Trapa natans TaxID=22666 RepID=A0AAN7QH82_TRANT|nr:hypothetical protein SAY86_026065 [Trapa natans]